MKKQILFIVFSLFLMGNTKPNWIEAIMFESNDVEESIIISKAEENELDNFLDAIGFYESGNNYKAVNSLGYMGKYQFGKRTLKGLGYDVSKSKFLNSPTIQEKAMMDLLSHNQHILRNYIDYWDGRKVNGKVITESGILAAAHLAGPSNVKKYFMHGKDFSDAYGTKLTKYLYTFSGYNIKID